MPLLINDTGSLVQIREILKFNFISNINECNNLLFTAFIKEKLKSDIQSYIKYYEYKVIFKNVTELGGGDQQHWFLMVDSNREQTINRLRELYIDKNFSCARSNFNKNLIWIHLYDNETKNLFMSTYNEYITLKKIFESLEDQYHDWICDLKNISNEDEVL